jgi:hypothetical protein
MRITEIASPEDQLALWKMVSDSMWAAFSQQVPQVAAGQGAPTPPVSTAAPSGAKPTDRPIIKAARKLKEKPKPRTAKPRSVPAPPPPKPPAPKAPAPPRPGTQAETKKSQAASNGISGQKSPSQSPPPLTSTQKNRQEALQHQQLVKYLQKALAQPQKPQRIQPQPPSPSVPVNAGYDERDNDELVLHSRAQNPFKTVAQTKSAMSDQKRGV